MARPDLSRQRTDEILDAFGACVLSCGLEGTTLEMVAQHAGVQRSLIRHYVGNRDEVLIAWATRSVANYRESLADILRALPRRNRAQRLVDYLFWDDNTRDADSELVMDILIARADQHAECRQLIADFVEDLICQVAEELRLCFPSAPKGRSFGVASTVVAVSLCAESLGPLKLHSKYRKAWKSTAQQLVAALGE